MFGVYRSSRLRLFEHAETEALLHPRSLLRFRRNVHSEAGEDGIVGFLVDSLGIEHGFCFEFGEGAVGFSRANRCVKRLRRAPATLTVPGEQGPGMGSLRPTAGCGSSTDGTG